MMVPMMSAVKEMLIEGMGWDEDALPLTDQ